MGIVARVFVSHSIGSAIGSVCVAEDGWRYHSVVKCCVEDFSDIRVRGFDPDSSKFIVPEPLSLSDSAIKVPAWHFCSEICTGSFHAYRRYSHLHHHLLALLGLEVCACIDIHHLGLVLPNLLFLLDYLDILERFRELCIEKHFLIVCPSAGESITSYGISSADLDMSIHRPVPAASVLKVNDDSCLI